MDRDDVFKRIGQEIQKKADKGMQKVRTNEERRERLHEIKSSLWKDNRISRDAKKSAEKQIDKMIERSHSEKTRYTVNKDVEKKIEREVEGRVKAAIHRGDLPKPKIDNWMREKMEKIRRNQW